MNDGLTIEWGWDNSSCPLHEWCRSSSSHIHLCCIAEKTTGGLIISTMTFSLKTANVHLVTEQKIKGWTSDWIKGFSLTRKPTDYRLGRQANR